MGTCVLSHYLPYRIHARPKPEYIQTAFYFGFLMKKEDRSPPKKKEEEEEGKKLTLHHHPSKENKHWNAMPPNCSTGYGDSTAPRQEALLH